MDSRLYVGNLSDDVSAEDLRKRFAEFGSVSDVELAVDRQSGRARGHAFVTMATVAEAKNAIERMDGTLLDDRRLRVNMAGERGTVRAKAEPVKITSQFRERNAIVYELDCAGVALSIKMSPEDPQERSWRIEATLRQAEAITVAASGPTRIGALEEVSASWQKNDVASGAAPLDWAAITQALATVRAI